MPKRSCAVCFNLIGVNTRMKILKELSGKRKMATHILTATNLTQPTISYHLRMMKKYGILLAKKEGKKVFYYVNKKFPCKGCAILELPFKYA